MSESVAPPGELLNRDGFCWLGRWVVNELEWVLAASQAGRFGEAYLFQVAVNDALGFMRWPAYSLAQSV